MATRWSWWRIPASLALLLVAGCTAHTAGPGTSVVTTPTWRAVPLPGPSTGGPTSGSTGGDAGPGRPDVRDLAACPGHWYAAGGYLAPDGSTSPALWTSADARTWVPVPTRPASVYGPGQLLTAVACRGGAAVAVGSTAGGVHGNPRTSTWLLTGGRLDEVPAAFELYGGPDAIGVGRVAAGPTGWLITGARRDANGRAGAAVWFAADGQGFRLVDADPALESAGDGQTAALDAVAGQFGPAPTRTAAPVPSAGGFTVVGSVLPPGGRAGARDPAAWTSPDGLTWRRLTIPGGPGDEALERAVPYGDGVLAAGERGDGFGAWLGTAGGWRAVGRFGGFTGTGLPRVHGLAAGASGRAYALVADGARYLLWGTRDLASWGPLPLPVAVPVGGQHQVSLAGTGGRLLLAAEDGKATRLWTAAG